MTIVPLGKWEFRSVGVLKKNYLKISGRGSFPLSVIRESTVGMEFIFRCMGRVCGVVVWEFYVIFT